MYEPGVRLAIDETAQPGVVWLAYSDGGSVWSACYVDGDLLRYDPDGWHVRDGRHKRVSVADATLVRARACMPDVLALWPGQDELGHVAAPLLNGHVRPVLVTVAHVPPERVQWLWPAHVPLAKLTVLDGDPGLGKSTLTLDLAARVTTGTPLPDGAPVEYRGAVVIVSAEDGIADTIRPRLAAAGADMERVHVLDGVEYSDEEGRLERRPVELPGDLGVIEEAVQKMGAVMVVIDPLTAYLSDRVDSYKDQHVRRALMPVARLAERARVAIVIVRHLSKSGGANALYRGGGSIGIIGAARAGLLVAPDPDDESRRILAATKQSNAKMPPALAFRVRGDELFDCGVIQWEGATAHTANDLLVVPLTVDVDHDLSDAARVLRDILGEADGWMWTKEAIDAMADAGFSKDQAKRAKAKLQVFSAKQGKPGDSVQGWKWCLPGFGRERVEGEGSEGGGSQKPAPFAPFGPEAHPSDDDPVF